MDKDIDVFEDDFNDLFATILTPNQEESTDVDQNKKDFEDDSFDDVFLQIPSQLFAQHSGSTPCPGPKPNNEESRASNSKAVILNEEKHDPTSNYSFKPSKLEPKKSNKLDSATSSKKVKLDTFFQKANKVTPSSSSAALSAPKKGTTKSTAKTLLPKKHLLVYQEGANFNIIERFNAKTKSHAQNLEMTPEFSPRLTHYVVDRLSDGSVMKNAKYYAAIGFCIWILHPAWIGAVENSKDIPDEEGYEVANYDKECTAGKLARQLKLKILEGIFIKKVIEIPLFNFRFREEQICDLLKVNGAKISIVKLEALRAEVKTAKLTNEEKKKNGKTMFIMASNIGPNMEICQNCFFNLGCLTVDPDYFLRLLDNYSTKHAKVWETECFLPKLMVKAKNADLVEYA